MAEINVSVTGDAGETGNSQPSVPFSLSFSVDGSAPISNQYLFDLVVPVQNLLLNVDGQTFTSATAEIWGQSPYNGACCAIDVGIEIRQPGFDFGWTTESAVSTGSTLGNALLTEGFGTATVHSGTAGMNPHSVPEPGMLALLAVGLVLLYKFSTAPIRH